MKILQDAFALNASPLGDLNGNTLILGGQGSPITIYVIVDGEALGGKVVIEEADDENYSGTWSELDSVDLADLTGGAQLAVHLVPASYRAIRGRIEDPSGSGTVTVKSQPSGIQP